MSPNLFGKFAVVSFPLAGCRAGSSVLLKQELMSIPNPWWKANAAPLAKFLCRCWRRRKPPRYARPQGRAVEGPHSECQLRPPPGAAYSGCIRRDPLAEWAAFRHSKRGRSFFLAQETGGGEGGRRSFFAISFALLFIIATLGHAYNDAQEGNAIVGP